MAQPVFSSFRQFWAAIDTGLAHLENYASGAIVVLTAIVTAFCVHQILKLINSNNGHHNAESENISSIDVKSDGEPQAVATTVEHQPVTEGEGVTQWDQKHHEHALAWAALVLEKYPYRDEPTRMKMAQMRIQKAHQATTPTTEKA